MCGERCLVLCQQWRFWIRPLIIVVYAAILLGGLPYLVYTLVQTGVETITFAWLIGGLFAFLTIPISLWEIIQHLINYTKPKLQKHIIRILWMVPVYALNAWLVLKFPSMGLYLDTARECYEAYAIYNFMMFLLNFLDDVMDLDTIMEIKPPTPHIFPLCCLKSWPMGREFIHRCKHGILQYTVFHLMTSLIAFICGLAGVYEEGNFSPNNAFVYLFVINNVSQFVAMYCLVLFYRAMVEELQPMSPLAKFLCIKCVVFFSFFQGVGIMILVKTGVIKEVFGTGDLDKQKSNILQDFLICIEMFIAAVAHHYAFSYKPYIDPEYETGNCCHAFLLIWDVSDVRSDIREHVHVVREGMKRRLISPRTGVVTGARGEAGIDNERQRLIAPHAHTSGHSSLQRYMSTSESEHDILIDKGEESGPEDVKTM